MDSLDNNNLSSYAKIDNFNILVDLICYKNGYIFADKFIDKFKNEKILFNNKYHLKHQKLIFSLIHYFARKSDVNVNYNINDNVNFFSLFSNFVTKECRDNSNGDIVNLIKNNHLLINISDILNQFPDNVSKIYLIKNNEDIKSLLSREYPYINHQENENVIFNIFNKYLNKNITNSYFKEAIYKNPLLSIDVFERLQNNMDLSLKNDEYSLINCQNLSLIGHIIKKYEHQFNQGEMEEYIKRTIMFSPTLELRQDLKSFLNDVLDKKGDIFINLFFKLNKEDKLKTRINKNPEIIFQTKYNEINTIQKLFEITNHKDVKYLLFNNFKENSAIKEAIKQNHNHPIINIIKNHPCFNDLNSDELDIFNDFISFSSIKNNSFKN